MEVAHINMKKNKRKLGYWDEIVRQMLASAYRTLGIKPYLKVTKMFSEQKQAHVSDGTIKHQPNKMGMTSQYLHTIPTSCAIFSTMPCVCCVHTRVVEGSGEGSAGCVVMGVQCMLMCMESEFCCGWLQLKLLLKMADMAGICGRLWSEWCRVPC